MTNSSGTPTTRLALPGPVGSDDAFPPADFEALRQRLDQITAVFDQGATLPATVPAKGTFYWHTTGQTLYYSDGTSLSPVMPSTVEIPIGGVLEWPSPVPTSAPPGPATWLERLGQTITKTAYPKLFDAWGVTDSTLVLTDTRGRSPMGAGQGPGLSNRTVGQLLGSEGVTLPSHTHPASMGYSGTHTHGGQTGGGGAHAHNYGRFEIGNPQQFQQGAPGGQFWSFQYFTVAAIHATDPVGNHVHAIGSDGNHLHSLSISSAGSDASHANVHPVSVTRWFVRAA